MKHIIVIIFLISPKVIFAQDDVISITFTEENAKYWQYISDRTMGGISDGKAVLDKEGDRYFARLTGNVSTENNGGFIQLRSTLSFINFDKRSINLKGVRIKVRGNGEVYHIFIRTSDTRSYRDYHAATFIAEDQWTIVDLPFSKFKNRFSNKELDGNDIRTFGIVAYGRNFQSDVSVSEINLY